jgi:hypothetical protein
MATTVDSTRETVSLIGSDKVEGTAVYGSDDNKIGSVQRVMIDKISGKVAYAVISFGGFLGMGEDYYPLPWSNLKYDTNVGGYRVGITEDQLKGAPKYTRSTEWDWSDRARDREVYAYYKTPLWYWEARAGRSFGALFLFTLLSNFVIHISVAPRVVVTVRGTNDWFEVLADRIMVGDVAYDQMDFCARATAFSW